MLGDAITGRRSRTRRREAGGRAQPRQRRRVSGGGPCPFARRLDATDGVQARLELGAAGRCLAPPRSDASMAQDHVPHSHPGPPSTRADVGTGGLPRAAARAPVAAALAGVRGRHRRGVSGVFSDAGNGSDGLARASIMKVCAPGEPDFVSAGGALGEHDLDYGLQLGRQAMASDHPEEVAAAIVAAAQAQQRRFESRLAPSLNVARGGAGDGRGPSSDT